MFFTIFLFIFIINSLIFIALNISTFRELKTSTKVNINSMTSQSVVYNVIWGGTGYDDGIDIEVFNDTYIYVVGSIEYGAGLKDILLIKYYKNGTKIWNTTWGGIYEDVGDSIMFDPMGNIYVSGYTNSYGAGDFDFALVKFYPNGTKAWNTTWGGALEDRGLDITYESNGYIYYIGLTKSFGAGNSDIALVVFDLNGTRLGNLTWGGPNDDYGYKILLDSNGSIYMIGTTYSQGAGLADYLLIKLDSSGTELWNITWGGIYRDYGISGILDTMGNIYIIGYTFSYGAGNTDFGLVKFYPNGTKAWNTTWGGKFHEVGFDIVLDENGNIITTGYTNSSGAGDKDVSIVKFKSDGDLILNITWGGALEDVGSGITSNDGYVYSAGYTENFGANNEDLALIKFDLIKPWSNHPLDAIYAMGIPANITWVLYDDHISGSYSIFLNGIKYIDWTLWTNNTPIIIPLNTNNPGIWNYTIKYNDSANNFGISDTVIIIIKNTQLPQIPNFLFIMTIIGLLGAIILSYLLKTKKLIL